MKDKIAVIAGGGDLPKVIIKALEKQKRNYILFGFDGHVDRKILLRYHGISLKLGKVGKLFDNLKKHDIKEVTFIGHIKRPNISNLKLDATAIKILKETFLHKSKGDNDILTKIIQYFEKVGIKVVAPQSITTDILVKEIFIGDKTKLNDEFCKEINALFKDLKLFSVLDIGQSFIYENSRIISVEGAEGTQKMIKRSKRYIASDNAVLIKVKKKNQDTRVDLPSIGPKTVRNAYKSKLSGIIVEAGSTIILHPEKTYELIKKYNMFLMGLKINEKI